MEVQSWAVLIHPTCGDILIPGISCAGQLPSILSVLCMPLGNSSMPLFHILCCWLTSGWSPRANHHGCNGSKWVTRVLKRNGNISARSLLCMGWSRRHSRGHSRNKAGGLHAATLCLFPPLLESHGTQSAKEVTLGWSRTNQNCRALQEKVLKCFKLNLFMPFSKLRGEESDSCLLFWALA